jgi:hypothetical protein
LRILAWLTFGFALAFSVGCTLATLFDTPVDQRLPLAVLILVGSLIAVVPARVKHHTAAAGAALLTVAATAGFSLPWQATAILNTAVVAALVALALVAVSSYPPASPKAGHRSLSWVRAGSAGFLVLHTGIVVPDTQPTTVYAAALLLLVSLAAQFANRVGGQQSRSAVLSTAPVAIPLGLFVLIPALPAIWAVLGSPYRWLGHIWSGRPAGSGVSISDAWPAGSPGEISVALAVLTVAAGVVGFAWNRTAWRLALNVGAITLLIGLAALDAPWPTIPAVSLLLGLLGLLSGRYALPLLLVGAGLAGTLPTEGTTIAGLSLLFIASVAVARLGRTREIRFVAWWVSVAAAATTGAAAALAAGAIRPVVALWVLAAAALALAASAVLRGRIDAPEVVAIEAGGHATALVALLLTIPSGKYAAIACGLWGVAVGVRALWPVENLAARNGRVIAAAGCELLAWWLVLAINGVGPVEVYTLPAAMVALAVSLLIQRGQPVLRSWVVYGPALAAAMLPSLALVLSDPEPLRRLLLGLGAVGVVVLGGVWRQQAPVAIGGVVLAIATLHELALVAQLLPAWIPITILGGLLVWLAITYERRRRDVSRFRHELKGMS